MENGMEREQYIKKLSEAAKHTFWDYLGCSLESLSDNKVVVTLDIKPHHLNLMGIVHGGVTSSLLDNAMGIAVMAARPNDQCVTTNLNVHFVSPLKKRPSDGDRRNYPPIPQNDDHFRNSSR